MQVCLDDSDIAPAFLLAPAEQAALLTGAVVLHKACSNLPASIAFLPIRSLL
jgi:hypothetical protein